MSRFMIIYFALLVLVLSSCQKSGSQDAVVSGMNGQCVNNPATCNTSAYQQAQGYSVYNYNNNNGSYGNNNGSQYYNPFTYYNNSAYLCNCPYGSYPTYNSYYGLGCVHSSTMSGFSGFFYLGWNNNRWSAQAQLGSYYGGGSTYSACYNGAVQSCAAGPQSSCPQGYVCNASATGSSIGLCVFSHR